MKNKTKFIISSSGILLIIFIFVLCIPFITIGAMFGLGNSIDEEGSINEELLKQYEILQDDIEQEADVKVDLVYIYGVDGVKRDGDFRNVNTILVNMEDMNSFYYNEDGSNKLYKKEQKQTVYELKKWNKDQVEMFEFYVKLFDELGYSSLEYSGEFVKPIEKGVITNEFQEYDALDQADGHTGIDMTGSKTIYPIAEGKVIKVFSDSSGGNQVMIKHNIDEEIFISNYAHLSKSSVEVGDKVKVDTPIGKMGETGESTGVHLHLEIIKSDEYIHSDLENPREYITFPAKGEWWEEREDYVGNEDHEKWMEQAGINKSDYSSVDYIVYHESSWDYKSENESSGAYGLCQALPPEKMEISGSDWKTNPVTQLKWCDSYATSRYGSWSKAEEFWKKNNWW